MKIVLLGDSIRLIGYGTKINEFLPSDCDLWQPEDNCRFSFYTLLMLNLDAEKMKGADVIHWNNGLWDTCDRFGEGYFVDKATYVDTMKRIAKILLGYGKRVIFATTTPVKMPRSDNNNERIAAYNAAIVPELLKMGVEINDLYSLVEPHIEEYICDDRIHLSEIGKTVCAERVANVILGK